ncbi:flagellar M-ring protein FliF [bacterium]|nr:flagellar M-ring protein FliF [bacterium]
MENNLKPFLDDIKKLWDGLDLPQKIGLLVLTVITVAVAAYMLAKSFEPEWVVLYNDLPQTDIVNIVEAFKKNGQTYKVSEDKKAILVPAKDKENLKMFVAENSLIENQSPGFELLDDMQLGSTDFKNKLTKQRIFQGELVRSIERMNGIKSCRVQLADPERSIFEDKDEAPSASVMLILNEGYRLKASQVKAIKNLVAYSVPRLTPERVFITDQNGASLSEETGKNSNDMETFKSNAEKQTAAKVTQVLEKIVGKGNVSVQVNADIDFNSTKATIETYVPVGEGENGYKGVLTTSQSEVETYENPNQTPVNANVQARNLNYAKEKNSVNYSVSKEIKQVVYAPGTIKRMTIAVAVNKILTDSEKEELQNLVLSAAGANYERGDVITVSSLQFEALEEEQKKQEVLEKEIKTKATVDYVTKDLGPLLVVLILGLAALFIIRSIMGKMGIKFNTPEAPPKVYEPQLPQITEAVPEIKMNETLPSIEANIDPELERARMELNDTIMADPAEAARLLVSYIKD